MTINAGQKWVTEQVNALHGTQHSNLKYSIVENALMHLCYPQNLLQNNFNPHANLCFLLHFPLIVIVGPVSLSDCRRSLQLLLIFLLWDLAQGSTAVSIFQRSSLAWISKFHESTCTSNHSQYDLYHVYIKIYHLKVYIL